MKSPVVLMIGMLCITAIIVTVLVTRSSSSLPFQGTAPTQAEPASARPSQTTEANQPPSHPKRITPTPDSERVGDSFAKAAILAAIAIEQSAGDPTSPQGERAEVSIKEKMNAAEAEATTAAEDSDLALLNELSDRRLEGNLSRAASSAMAQAAGGSGDNSGLADNDPESECLSSLIAKLKARSGGVPKDCGYITR
jgi:cytoskeletal protein RodZ